MIDLRGKKGLVVGIANESSIAYGCAKIFRREGADLAITFLNQKAEPYVRPLANSLQSPLILPCDVENNEQLENVFDVINNQWGRLDFLLHSIAFSPKQDLQGRVVDSSREGFAQAMDISCHSFVRMAKLAEPLMKHGGTLLTVSYYGADKVVTNYNLMGPVKAALQMAAKYMAAELGPSGIRVNVLSPGPVKTRAASGLAHFDKLLEQAADKSPQHRLVSIEDIGEVAAFLVSDSAKAMTGEVIYIDSGYHIID